MKKINKDYIEQLKTILKNIYFKNGILPLKKEDFYRIVDRISDIGDITYTFVSKNYTVDEYLNFLYEVLVEYLKSKKTKSADILLSYINDTFKKDRLIEHWKLIINNKIKEEDIDSIEKILYSLLSKVTDKMIRNHAIGIEKVENAFYKLGYLIFAI